MIDLCPTCDEPYNKEDPSTRAQLCSNPFHCCKDCVWKVVEHEWYSTGEILKFCDFHEEWEKEQE